ncbi:MAG TPA: hypothetical protein VJ529_03830 [Candidatus Bathyarchaeia archaeon]|nr:hypothetical protein [Candidatus Bathyarchaeia archaeon]
MPKRIQNRTKFERSCECESLEIGKGSQKMSSNLSKKEQALGEIPLQKLKPILDETWK